MGFIYLFSLGIFLIFIVFLNDLLKIIKKGESKYLGSLLAVLAISFTAWVIFGFLQNIRHPFDLSSLPDGETPRSALGALGDYFGGLLNPLFAFLSFMGVLWTLKMSREELSETRRVMDEQLKTQFLQQFDSLFFSLLSGIAQKINLMNENKVIDDLHKDIYKARFEIDIWAKKDYRTLLEIIYCLVQQIDMGFDQQKLFSRDEIKRYKNKYMETLRSSLEDKVLHFVVHDCLRDIDNPLVGLRKHTIEKFAFFQNLSYEGMHYPLKYWLLKAFTKFDGDIFGLNSSFIKFNQSNLFGLIKNKDAISFEWFLYDWLFEQKLLTESDVFECNIFDIAFNLIDNFNYKITVDGYNFENFTIESNSLILIFL